MCVFEWVMNNRISLSLNFSSPISFNPQTKYNTMENSTYLENTCNNKERKIPSFLNSTLLYVDLFLTDTNRGKKKLVFQNGNNLHKVFTQVFFTPVQLNFLTHHQTSDCLSKHMKEPLLIINQNNNRLILTFVCFNRLDGIVRDSKDIDHTRLNYFNKGLKLLTETLNSDSTHLKGNFHKEDMIKIFNKAIHSQLMFR